ncbi:MAG TPA: DNA-processing protein DprA [Tenuifilaceae bacterium]|nr:DNA-processing protein DprA [Tenuifilaceae bacterium]
MDTDILKYQIGIDMIPMIGSVNAKRLIAYCGGVEAVFKEKAKTLTKIPGIGSIIAKEIVNQKVLDRAAEEVDFVVKHGIRAIFYLDEDYPKRLFQCDDGPVVLFIKGNAGVDLNQSKVISVVGTRSITDYGRTICEELIRGLAQRGHNPIVVSGLAYGVDVCAHRAALKEGFQTVAVLGHGLDRLYPATHWSISKEIAETGALVTDFPSKTPFERNNFIKRNRIIAGLADATIVVESALKGGSLITADMAVGYNREVLAIPGNAGQKYSQGCNMLIKTNKAALIETAEDIEFQLGWESPKKAKVPKQTTLFPVLSAEEQAVLDALKENGQEPIDLLCLKTKMPVAKVSSLLLNLEFAGLVVSKPGKVFAIKNLSV